MLERERAPIYNLRPNSWCGIRVGLAHSVCRFDLTSDAGKTYRGLVSISD